MHGSSPRKKEYQIKRLKSLGILEHKALTVKPKPFTQGIIKRAAYVLKSIKKTINILGI